MSDDKITIPAGALLDGSVIRITINGVVRSLSDFTINTTTGTFNIEKPITIRVVFRDNRNWRYMPIIWKRYE